jgi:glycosyltransferase involved in cell wall biosynthesis
MAPKISVCIPTYNYGRFLPETIESVLRQADVDFEVVVQDNCSTDDTAEVVARYASRDGRVRYGRNESNLGMVGNWNRCLERATGEYVKVLCADDLLSDPGSLARMAAVLDSDEAVSLVASPRNVVDERSNFLRVFSCFPGPVDVDGKAVIRRCLRRRENLIGEPTVTMFRRKQAARGFSPRYRHIVDLEMWLHLLEQGRFVFLGEPLSSVRLHGSQETAANIGDQSDREDVVRLLDDYLPRPYVGIGHAMGWFLRYDIDYDYWKAGRRGRIPRERAAALIGSRRSMPAFLALLPLYKGFKPLLRLARRMGWTE